MLRAQDLVAKGTAPPEVTPITDLLGVTVGPGTGSESHGSESDSQREAEAVTWLRNLPFAPATNFMSLSMERQLAGKVAGVWLS
jgi:hypothetical protein